MGQALDEYDRRQIAVVGEKVREAIANAATADGKVVVIQNLQVNIATGGGATVRVES